MTLKQSGKVEIAFATAHRGADSLSCEPPEPTFSAVVKAFSTAPILAEGDLASNAASYSRHLRVANLSHETHRAYLAVVGQLGRFLTQHGMPTNVAAIRCELIEAFIDDQLARLRPASDGQSVREGA